MKLLKALRKAAKLSLRGAGEPRFGASTVRSYEEEGAQLMQIRYLAQLRRRCRVSWEELGRRIDEELKKELKNENESVDL